MAKVEKKKINAVLNVHPYSEMRKATKVWAESIPAFQKKIKPINIKDEVVADVRKWSDAKFSKAMQTFVRRDLQLFSSQVAQLQKNAEKKGPLGQKAAEKEFPKIYDKLVKHIEKKFHQSIEEIEQDKGDNSKGLKDGKVSLKKLNDLDFKKHFVTSQVEISSALLSLSKALKDKPDDKVKKEAFTAADRKIDKSMQSFLKGRNQVRSTVDALGKTESGIVKMKNDVGPELLEYSKLLSDGKKSLDALLKPIDDFEDKVNEVWAELQRERMSSKQAMEGAAEIRGFKDMGAAFKKVQSMHKMLKSEFSVVEKKLK